MELVDAALRSLENSLDRLASRLRGTEGETLQLFRARLMLDDSEALVAQARANGAIGHGWGDRLVSDLNHAAMLVAAVPVSGGPPFERAMGVTQDALASVREALPADA